jgi:hypothetical protein
MSNVTPIHGGNGQPPASLPLRPKKSRKRPEDRVGLQFADGGHATAFRAFMGLKGVCHALDALEGSADNIDEFQRLAAAAALLVDTLEQLQL